MSKSTTVPGTRAVPMVNGHAWEFSHNGWDYQVVCLNGSDQVRLSFRTSPDEQWAHGHTRPTNGRSAASVAREMYTYVTQA
jgi:hypothetical protein